MNEKILALAVMAKDEASATLNKINSTLETLEKRANLGERAMGAFHDVMRGIATGLGIDAWNDLAAVVSKVVGFFPSLIERGIAFATAVHNIQLETGTSAEAASQLAGQFEFFGLSITDVTSKLAIFSKNIIAHQADLKALGISIRDANGHTADQITLFNRVQVALSQMQSGTRKTREEQVLFGRSMSDLLPLLGLSADQVKELNAQLKAAGVIMDETAVQKAHMAEIAMHNLDLSMQGLGNTLAADLGPVIAQTVDNIANWVNQNSKNIAAFAENVINTIIGVIDGIFGLDIAAVSFSEKFATATATAQNFSPALDTLGDKADKAAKKVKKGADEARLAIEKQIRTIDDQVRAIDKETKAIDAQERSEDKVAAAATKARDAQIKGLNDQLSAQLKLLDAQDRERANSEREGDLAQQLMDAQRQLLIAQAGDANGVVDPDKVHSAMEQITRIQQQQGDLAYGIQQDAKRQTLQDNNDKAVSAIQTAQDEADAVAQSEHDKLESRKTALAATKQMLEDEKNTLQNKLADMKAAAAAAFTGAGGIGPSAAAAGQVIQGVSDYNVEALKNKLHDTHVQARKGFDYLGQGINPGLSGAMEAARLAGVKMGQDISKAIGGIGDALFGKDGKGGVVGALGTIIDLAGQVNSAIGGIDLKKVLIAGAAVAAATGNLPLAAVFLGLAGISILDGNGHPGGNTGDYLPSTSDPYGGTQPLGPTFDQNGNYHAPGTYDPVTGKPIPGTWDHGSSSPMAVTQGFNRSSQPLIVPVMINSREVARAVVPDINELLLSQSRLDVGSAPGSSF